MRIVVRIRKGCHDNNSRNTNPVSVTSSSSVTLFLLVGFPLSLSSSFLSLPFSSIFSASFIFDPRMQEEKMKTHVVISNSMMIMATCYLHQFSDLHLHHLSSSFLSSSPFHSSLFALIVLPPKSKSILWNVHQTYHFLIEKISPRKGSRREQERKG